MTSDTKTTTKRYVVAITGSIACGKSTIGAQLTTLGFDVFDTDTLAHELLNSPNPAYQAVLDRFGADLVEKPGAPINRDKLRAAAFANDKAKQDLESILHPAIEKLLADRIKSAKGEIVFVQVPLLFEAKLQDKYDEIWCVLTDRETQIARLKARNGLTEDEAKKRIALQFPQEKKAALSHRIIDNSGKPEDTLVQVKDCVSKARAVISKTEPAPQPASSSRNEQYLKLLKRGANLATTEALDKLGDVSTTRHKDAAAEMVMRVTSSETGSDGTVETEEHQLTVRLQMCVKNAKGTGCDPAPCANGGCSCNCGKTCRRGCGCSSDCGCSCPKPTPTPTPQPTPEPPKPPTPPTPPAPAPNRECKGNHDSLFALLGFMAFALVAYLAFCVVSTHHWSFPSGCHTHTCETPAPQPTPPPTPVPVPTPKPQPQPVCPGICAPSAMPPDAPVPPPVSEGCSEDQNPSIDPPAFILNYLHNQVRVRTATWTVKCKGHNQGAVVVGRDSKNQLTNWQDYGPNLRFNQQLIVNYGFQAVWIDRYAAPNEFTGRTLYQYDQYGQLLEVRRLDNQQRPVISATLMRNPEGSLCGVRIRRFNESGVVVEIQDYRPDAALLPQAFYMYELFGQFN